MAHRSVPPTDPDVDPFWHGALAQRPPVLERLAGAVRPLGSGLLVAIGVLAVVGAGWWLLRPGSPPVESTLPAAGAAPASAGGASGGAPTLPGAATTSTTATSVVVQAAGAVVKPGVYSLDAGARVDDLVEAAGGLDKSADLDRVNLAAPVGDGERVWVPRVGEDSVPDVVAGSGGGAVSGGAAGAGSAAGGATAPTPAAPIDLNQASAEELDGLPGVGPATAAAILAYRDEHGRFASVGELLDVPGIGDAKLERIRPLVRV